MTTATDKHLQCWGSATYNRVETERVIPKSKLYSSMVMRYLAIVLGRCSNHQYSCKNFDTVLRQSRPQQTIIHNKVARHGCTY